MLFLIIQIVIIGLILYLVYYVIGKFVSGKPYQIIGLILVLIFVLYLLNAFGILGGRLLR